VITFFSIPRGFDGEAGTRQRNAIESWTRVAPDVQVLLLGSDAGVDTAARELGVEHFPELALNEYGTPLLDDAFRIAQEHARHPLVAYVNTDIVVLDDFAAAGRELSLLERPFLMIGECWDAPLGPLDFEGDWRSEVGAAASAGRKRGAAALDYFLFTTGLYSDVPPFAVGRLLFDNWLVWRARRQGVAVVDATRRVRPVHQRHGYAHIGGTYRTAQASPEAAANWALVGSKSRIYTRFDASHLLTERGLRRNIGATWRAKERVRKALYKLRRGQLRPVRMPT
jgi:hypothetical protein